MKAEYKDNAMEALEQAPSEVRRALFKQVNPLQPIFRHSATTRHNFLPLFLPSNQHAAVRLACILQLPSYREDEGAEFLRKIGFVFAKSL